MKVATSLYHERGFGVRINAQARHMMVGLLKIIARILREKVEALTDEQTGGRLVHRGDTISGSLGCCLAS